MVLKSVENRLERLFERTFSRPFKSALQPIEIGTRIMREVDLTRRLSSQGPISAQLDHGVAGAEDADRFEGFQKALVTELEETVRQHAVGEGYNFVGPVSTSRSSSTTTSRSATWRSRPSSWAARVSPDCWSATDGRSPSATARSSSDEAPTSTW